VTSVLSQIEAEAEILSGRCLPYGDGITFWPVNEIVKQAAEITETDSPQAARAKIVSSLEGDEAAELVADRLAEVIGLGTDPASAQDIFWALRRLFEARARRRPLVVVLDDVNWGEPTFLDLVEHLPGWSRDAPILLLCMARPELLDVRPGWASSTPNATTLRLEPLAEDETRALVENIGGEVDDVVVRRVIEAAEGNPFFVEEMLAALVDDGLSTTSVPATIQVLLAARLDRLDAGERRALECAAVEGKEFHGGAVAALAGRRVGDALFGLVRKDLIRPHRAAFAGEDGFAFRHILLRDAAYEGLPKARRAQLHERYADWLEWAARERLVEYEELIGYHLEQGFRYRIELGPADDGGRSLARRAADRLRAAGYRALARGDARAATGLLDRAASLLARGAPDRPELLVVLGRALCEAGDLSRAEGVLDTAVQEAAAAGDDRLQARARVWRLTVGIQQGAGFEECVVQTNEAIAVLEGANDDLGLAQAFQFGGKLELWRGRSVAAVGLLERSLAHARRANDRRDEIEALSWLLIGLFFGATPASEAIRRCDQIRRSAVGNTQLEAYAMISRGGLDAMQNRIDEGRETVARGREMLHDLGAPLVWAAGATVAGSVELMAGNEHAAEDVMQPAYELLEQIGETGYLSTLAAYLAEALYRQSREDESHRYTRISERVAAADDFESQASWRAVRAKLKARQGRAEEAERIARQAVEIARKTDFLDLRGRTLLSLAEVLQLAGQRAPASRIRAEAIGEFERKENLVMAHAARESVPS
jgi:tetratricopeptide (TPR) repeat protein